MYDTVKAYVKLDSEDAERIRLAGAAGSRPISWSAVRYWWNEGGDAPRLTYIDSDQPRLIAEFSAWRMARVMRRTDTVTDAERDSALDRVNAHIRDRLGITTDVRTWTAIRTDYAINMQVAPGDVGAYLDVLSRLDVRTMSRHEYDPRNGVVWKSAGKRGHWIKFYHVDAAIGDGLNRGWLRFEVANMAQRTRYLARSWFQCERTVAEMLQRGRALVVLADAWRRLGLAGDGDVWCSDDTLHYRLRTTYGRSSSAALGALTLIREHGQHAITHDLMSSASYYAWRERLMRDGFLTHAARSLEALKLPTKELQRFVPQNLAIERGAAPPINKKISAEKLGAPGAPENLLAVLND